MRMYIFMLDENNHPSRIPLAKWDRVLKKQQAMIELAGTCVKIAYAYIELEDRRPVYCPRIDGVLHFFDESGYIAESHMPPVDLIANLKKENEKVVDLEHYLRNRDYWVANRWDVQPAMIQKIIDKIWN